MSSAAKSSSYTADDIEVLEGLEPVRKRPAMYIGGTDSRGLHHLLWEILDNSIDEYLNGHADHITLTIHKDGRSATITDNGRGIPIDRHKKHKKTALELILTTLHAGGKFSDKNYLHSGGLHGVGASVVNALSKELVATVKRDGAEWSQRFVRGIPKGDAEKIGKATGHGTTIFFRPDETIFPKTDFVADVVKTHLEDVSYIHSGLKITFHDETKGRRSSSPTRAGSRTISPRWCKGIKRNSSSIKSFTSNEMKRARRCRRRSPGRNRPMKRFDRTATVFEPGRGELTRLACGRRSSRRFAITWRRTRSL